MIGVGQLAQIVDYFRIARALDVRPKRMKRPAGHGELSAFANRARTGTPVRRFALDVVVHAPNLGA